MTFGTRELNTLVRETSYSRKGEQRIHTIIAVVLEINIMKNDEEELLQACLQRRIEVAWWIHARVLSWIYGKSTDRSSSSYKSLKRNRASWCRHRGTVTLSGNQDPWEVYHSGLFYRQNTIVSWTRCKASLKSNDDACMSKKFPTSATRWCFDILYQGLELVELGKGSISNASDADMSKMCATRPNAQWSADGLYIFIYSPCKLWFAANVAISTTAGELHISREQLIRKVHS